MSVYDSNEIPRVKLEDAPGDIDAIFARERAEERRARTRTFLTRLNIRLRWSGGSGRVLRAIDILFLTFLALCVGAVIAILLASSFGRLS